MKCISRTTALASVWGGKVLARASDVKRNYFISSIWALQWSSGSIRHVRLIPLTLPELLHCLSTFVINQHSVRQRGPYTQLICVARGIAYIQIGSARNVVWAICASACGHPMKNEEINQCNKRPVMQNVLLFFFSILGMTKCETARVAAQTDFIITHPLIFLYPH